MKTRETTILTWMRHAGRQLGAVALLALLARAILPAGYMLASADTPDGRYLIIQLCDGHAAPATAIDLRTGKQIAIEDIQKQNAPSNGTATSPCVFAATPHFATPLATAEPVTFSEIERVDFVVALAVSPGRGIAAPPPPATGPPALI